MAKCVWGVEARGRPMDSTRELRAMQLVLFPCPPIPIECKQGDENYTTNSHDFLSMLIDVAMRRNNQDDNFKRAAKQAELIDKYYEGECYDVEHRMQEFTREWLGTFNSATREVRFLPLEATTPRITQQAREWLSAQHILMGRDTNAKQFQHLAVPDLYKQCYDVKKRMDTVDEVDLGLDRLRIE